MLRESGGIEKIGSISWELVLCLLAAWAFVFISLYKGVKSSGKVCLCHFMFISYILYLCNVNTV